MTAKSCNTKAKAKIVVNEPRQHEINNERIKCCALGWGKLWATEPQRSAVVSFV